MKITPAAILNFCALIFFCVFVYMAQDWRLQARFTLTRSASRC